MKIIGGLKPVRILTPRLSESNGLVNQIFTEPFSLVVQKVVQKFYSFSSDH